MVEGIEELAGLVQNPEDMKEKIEEWQQTLIEHQLRNYLLGAEHCRELVLKYLESLPQNENGDFDSSEATVAIRSGEYIPESSEYRHLRVPFQEVNEI